jgi:hypothetical protein
MDLTSNGLDDHEAMTVINRFLSVMTWCDDNFAIAQHGSSLLILLRARSDLAVAPPRGSIIVGERAA